MPYPKQPEPERKRGVGVSLHPLTIRRVDALAGGPGERSAVLADAIELGLAQKFGPDWFIKADRILSQSAKEQEAA